MKADLPHQISFFSCCVHDNRGLSVSHESEGHVHDTHGHKTTTSSEHGEEKHEEAHKEKRAKSKGVTFTCSGSNLM